MNSFKKTRFLLQILYRNSKLYLQYLRRIDKASDKIESKLHKSLKNEELIQLLGLEKSLVYFSTSLKSNEIVLEKILRSTPIKMYPDDTELLEDVIIENKQAIEMANIYSNILTGTMDAYASVISNNLNIVMKFLTSVTIVLSIPTMVASFFGMNVDVPFENNPHAFAIIFVMTMFFSVILALTMVRKQLF
jgi:magnesium transporter